MTVGAALRDSNSGIACAGAAPEERVARFETLYDLRLPGAYRNFLLQFGDLRTSRPADIPVRILGLSIQSDPMQATRTLARLRATLRDFPADLIPVESYPNGQFACIEIGLARDPRVVHVDIEDPASYIERLIIATSFSRFLFRWLTDAQSLVWIWAHAEENQRKIERQERRSDQVPRPDEWRAYRFCSQDVVMGETLVKYDRASDQTLVGAFATAWLPFFSDAEPARALLSNIMTEAYRSSARPALRFVQGATVRRARTPDTVLALASDAGIRLNPRDALISGTDFSRLFGHVAALPTALRRKSDTSSLATSDAIACAVASGVWTPVEAECLLKWAHEPGRIFRGGADPLDRVAYLQDLRDVRRALMLGLFANRLRRPNASSSNLDSEDALVSVRTDFLVDEVRVRCGVPVKVDWALDGDAIQSAEFTIAVLVEGARRLAITLASRFRDRPAGNHLLAIVPRDVLTLEATARAELVRDATALGVRLLVAPLFTSNLDKDGAQRLERSRRARE